MVAIVNKFNSDFEIRRLAALSAKIHLADDELTLTDKSKWNPLTSEAHTLRLIDYHNISLNFTKDTVQATISGISSRLISRKNYPHYEAIGRAVSMASADYALHFKLGELKAEPLPSIKPKYSLSEMSDIDIPE